MTSFACGIQVQSFRKARGNSLATTMCIGNMRSGVHNLSHFIHTGDRNFLFRAGIYFDVIGCFVLGAILGSRLILPLGIHAIFCSTVLLMISFLLMCVRM